MSAVRPHERGNGASSRPFVRLKGDFPCASGSLRPALPRWRSPPRRSPTPGRRPGRQGQGRQGRARRRSRRQGQGIAPRRRARAQPGRSRLQRWRQPGPLCPGRAARGDRPGDRAAIAAAAGEAGHARDQRPWPRPRRRPPRSGRAIDDASRARGARRGRGDRQRPRLRRDDPRPRFATATASSASAISIAARCASATSTATIGSPAGSAGRDGCPPGLAKKPVAACPRARRRNIVGQPLIAAARLGGLDPLPRSLRSLYHDDDDYYYRYGDGYLYRVDRDDDLIASLLPLFGAALIGQPLSASYVNSYRAVLLSTRSTRTRRTIVTATATAMCTRPTA